MRSASLRAAIASGTSVGCRGAGMLRMISRKTALDLEIGDHLGIDGLGERDALVPAVGVARDAADHHDRALGALEQRRLLSPARAARPGGRRHVAGGVDGLQRLGQPRLLHLGIEIDVHRAHRRRLAIQVARISASRAAAGEAG